MNPTARFSPSRQTGFSLVELMVGLAIGMLATIVIIQVMSFFEVQRRTTTGSADAQTNGGIALYSIAREMQMAGYPLLPTTDSPLECTTVTYGGTGITGISPVVITNGAVVAGVNPTDRITIRFGDTMMGGAATQITSVVNTDEAVVLSNLSCAANDVTLITSGSSC